MVNKNAIWIVSLVCITLIIISGLYFLGNNNVGITGNVVKDSSIGEEGFVTKVIDGDTVIIGGESVRLLGIDSDERGYPCYNEAKKRIEELILNKEVELELDGEDRDQYERYLRYIFLAGKNINLQLVEEGLAVARFYPENVKYKQEILAAEQQARESKIGCKWGGQSTKSEPVIEIEQEPETELSPDAIGACNAGNYIGEEKTVEGKVSDTYKYKAEAVFLNLEKPYPNSCFTAVIWSSDWHKFPEDPEDYYYGKRVRIKGEIIEYQGQPEIILKELSQIEVVG